jgi:NADH-quinone oxidoreductase subunit C
MFEIKDELNKKLIDKLINKFKDGIIKYELSYDIMTITINKNIIYSLIDFLYKDDDLQFNFLTTLCGIHYPEQKESIGVIYHLHSFKNNHRIRLKSFSDIDNPIFPSITPIFKAANWMERETYDFFGIIFENHPNLKRILNIDEMDYYPMRKQYPVEDTTKEDKMDKMFGR